MKFIKQNWLPFLVAGLFAVLWLFPVWSHIEQRQDLISLNSRVDTVYDDTEKLKFDINSLKGDGPLVGASSLFAQNASIQVNLEVLGFASVSGNLNFFGEIRPDGVTCANNEILKRTGADNWDCAADATGSVASNSIDWDEIVPAMTLDTNTSSSFSTFNLEFNLNSTGDFIISDGDVNWFIFDDASGASNSRPFELNGTNTYLGLGNAGVRLSEDGDGAITFLGLGNGTDEDFTLNLDDVSNEITVTTTTGVTHFLFNAISVSSSLNFEAVGYASASAYFGVAFGSTGDCNDSGDLLGWDSATGLFSCRTGNYEVGGTDVALADGGTGATLTDPNDDRLFTWDDSAGATVLMDLGAKLTTTADPLLTIASNSLGFADFLASMSLDTTSEIVLANLDYVVNLSGTGDWRWEDNGTVFCTITDLGEVNCGEAASFEIPNSSGPTVNAAGEIAVDTASQSFNFYDGTQEKVINGIYCPTWIYESPTARENWGAKRFHTPITIVEYSYRASGSNAVGFQMNHGAQGAITTDLWNTNKSASGSSLIKSDRFNDATLNKGDYLELEITSASATIEELSVTLCYRITP